MLLRFPLIWSQRGEYLVTTSGGYWLLAACCHFHSLGMSTKVLPSKIRSCTSTPPSSCFLDSTWTVGHGNIAGRRFLCVFSPCRGRDTLLRRNSQVTMVSTRPRTHSVCGGFAAGQVSVCVWPPEENSKHTAF